MDAVQHPYLQTKVRPLRFRWWHRIAAKAGGYFWLPCPSCGQSFGGHEWRTESEFAVVGKWGVCPACTEYNSAHPDEWARLMTEETSPAVERALAHFHKVSDELMRERCRTLEVALWKLANECDGLRAFEADVRAVVGNTNWGVLRLRVGEARDILKPIPEDILRAAARGQQ